MKKSAYYINYIKSDAWKRKRLEYFARYGKFCQACGTRKNIVVHHLTYDRLGNELLTDLKSLCSVCHLAVHAQHRKKGGNLAFWTNQHVFKERKKRKL